MPFSKLLLLTSFVLLQFYSFSQKTEITHEDLATWNRISNRKISNNGQYIAYRLTKEIGNPSINTNDGQNQETWSYPRAKRPTISSDSRYVAFLIPPDQDSIKMLKRKKTKKDNMPHDSLAILDLSTMALTKIPHVQRFELPERWSGWIAYQLEPEQRITTNGANKTIQGTQTRNHNE